MMPEKRQRRLLIIHRETIAIALSAVVVAATFFFVPGQKLTSLDTYDTAPAVAQTDLSLVQQKALTATLHQVAQYFNAAPINAKMDRWLKLIPGLNGVQLDITQTLLHATQNAQTTRLYFKQIPPQVSNESFGAAPIYQANVHKRQMALMINVAWGTEYVPQILQILKRNQVHATFFLDGSWTRKNPSVAKLIVDSGMEVGNHAYNHPMMSKISRTQIIAQITKTNDVVRQATGIQPNLFAPPAGDFNQIVVDVAQGLHMRTILWTLDTIDWKKPSPALIVSRIVTKKTPGAMVLMHPTKPTVLALPIMIHQLVKDGYQLVTVSQILSPDRSTPKTLGEALSMMTHS